MSESKPDTEDARPLLSENGELQAPDVAAPKVGRIRALTAWFESKAVLRKVLWLALEAAVVVLCAGVVFFQRLLDLEQIEVGGDAITVWEFARQLVLGGDFPNRLNHHTSRFGLVIPSMVTQWIFGSHATTYYVGPLIGGVLLHVWVYLIGRKLSGPVGGAAGVVLLLLFEPMVRASSQILPEAYGPMYAAFAIYCALLYTDAKTLWGRWLALVAVGLGLIFAYGAKEVFLFYAPGVAFIVWFGGAKGPLLPERLMPVQQTHVGDGRMTRAVRWLSRSKLVVPGVLALLVLFLILIETIFLSTVSDSGNRFNVVSTSHGGGGASGPRIRDAVDFFALYTRAPVDWKQAFIGVVLAWLGVMAFARDRRTKLVGLTLFVFFLLQTFIVRNLDPLTPWFRPHPRYLLGMVGTMAIVVGIFVGDTLTVIFRGPKSNARPEGKERFFLLMTALLFLIAVGAHLPERFQAEWGNKNAWHKTAEISEQLTRAYVAGIPIVAETQDGKPAWAAAALLIDPRQLLDEEGKPIPSHRLLKKYGRGRFVARAALSNDIRHARLKNAVAHRVRGKKCAVIIRQSIRFITGRVTFDKSCDSLEEEFRKNPNAGKTPVSDSSSHKRRARVARNRRVDVERDLRSDEAESEARDLDGPSSADEERDPND